MRRAVLIAGLAAAGCGSKGESARGAVGGAIAAGITAAVTATSHERAPWRCAALDGPAPPAGSISAGGMTWTLDGHHATRAAARAAAPIRIAFLADAEGPTPETLGVLRAMRDKLARLHVDAIVSLGGLGSTEAEVHGVLDAVADGTALVLAIPGDREGAAAHRAAVGALATRGVVDGSVVRWLVIGRVGIVTLPGQPFAGRLANGVEGCAHTDADVAAVLATAPDGVEVTILASQRAPRHADGSDRAALGASAGDPGFAVALRGAGAGPGAVDLVVHGSLDGGPSAGGKTAPGGARSAVATGVASASPRLDAAGRRLTPAILVVTVDGNRIGWQPIGL